MLEYEYKHTLLIVEMYVDRKKKPLYLRPPSLSPLSHMYPIPVSRDSEI